MNSSLLKKPVFKPKSQPLEKNQHLQKLKIIAQDTRSTFLKVVIAKKTVQHPH